MTEDKNKMNQTSPECSVPKDPEVDNPNKEGRCSPEFPTGKESRRLQLKASSVIFLIN